MRATAGIEQVNAQPPPRRAAPVGAGGSLAGLMGQLLQGMGNPPGPAGTPNPSRTGGNPPSLGGALSQLLQGAGHPAGPNGTAGPQSRSTSGQHQQQSSTSPNRAPRTEGTRPSSGMPAERDGADVGSLGGALGQLLQGLGGAPGPADPAGSLRGTPAGQQPGPHASRRDAEGDAQPAAGVPGGQDGGAGGLGGALGQLLQGLGNAPGGADSTGSQVSDTCIYVLATLPHPKHPSS